MEEIASSSSPDKCMENIGGRENKNLITQHAVNMRRHENGKPNMERPQFFAGIIYTLSYRCIGLNGKVASVISTNKSTI